MQSRSEWISDCLSCGVIRIVYAFILGKTGEVTLTLLEGCWTLIAFVAVYQNDRS